MNREEWLKVRATPKKDLREKKFVHIATNYQWVNRNLGKINNAPDMKFIKASPGTTRVRKEHA